MIIINKIIWKSHVDEVTASYLTKNSLSSLGIQAGSYTLGILLSYVLTLFLGAEGYGAFTFVFSAILMISVFASFGIDDLAVREIAKSETTGLPSATKAYLKWSFRSVSALTILVMAVSWIILNYFTVPGFAGQENLFNIALLALPFIVLMQLSQGLLRGCSQIIKSQTPERLIRPVALMVFVIILFYTAGTVSVGMAILFNVIAFAITCAVYLYFIYRNFKPRFRHTTDGYSSSTWRKSAFYFFLLSVVTMLSLKADLLMIGTMVDNRSVGIYNIAARLVDLVSFPLMIINPVIAPLFSGLYQKKCFGDLQQIFTRCARVTTFIAFVILAVFALFGKPILGIFGEEFIEGYSIILILGAGSLFNVYAGSVGNLLTMAGFEREAFAAQLSSVVIALILHLLLIPMFQITGAAIATATAMVVRNGVMMYFVKKRMAINTGAF